MPQAGGDDHGRADALLGRAADDVGDRLRRRGDDGEVGRGGQVLQAWNGPNAVDMRITRVDDVDIASESAIDRQ